jgi:hypothetical protein
MGCAARERPGTEFFFSERPIKLDAPFFALNTKLGLLQFKKPGPFTLTYKTTAIVS